MGILESILKSVTGNSSVNTNPNAMGGILDMITGGSASGGTGGIQGLIKKLTDGGLGDTVKSWIGTGNNEPVEPNQLQNALGHEVIAKLATKMGVSQSEAASHLSKLLPSIIDQLTPEGKLPESGNLDNVQDLMK